MSDRDRKAPKSRPGQPVAKAADDDAEKLTAQPKPAALTATLQAHIGRQLRGLYDEVVKQPVPDRFVQLLEELERKRTDRG